MSQLLPDLAASPQFHRALVVLFLIQFLSWSGMFALWITAIPVVAGQVLHLGTQDAAGLQPAVVAVSLGFATYALLGTLGGFVVPGLIRRIGHGWVYGAALLIGAIGLALFGRAHGGGALVPAFLAIGVGWSAMGSIPYGLLSKLVPEGRGAHYTRLFGFSTVLPQLVTTLGLALLAPRLFGAHLSDALLIGAGAMALGGLIAILARGLFAPADAVEDNW